MRLLVIIVAVLAAQGCGYRAGPTDEALAAYTEHAPPTGKAVTYFIYTHCGVESARIGGRWWHTQPPLYGEGGAGDPPEGWDDPHQQGRLVVESARRATFAAHGTTVVLVPSTTGEPLHICA